MTAVAWGSLMSTGSGIGESPRRDHSPEIGALGFAQPRHVLGTVAHLRILLRNKNSFGTTANCAAIILRKPFTFD